MSKHRDVYLKPEERDELETMLRRGRHGARELRRAQVLVQLDRSQGAARTLATVAERCQVSVGTVSNVKRRYFDGGVARALYDLPRPGGVPKLTGEEEAHLIALACSPAPHGHERWSLRLLAEQLVVLEVVDSVSHVTVGKVLKKTS